MSMAVMRLSVFRLEMVKKEKNKRNCSLRPVSKGRQGTFDIFPADAVCEGNEVLCH